MRRKIRSAMKQEASDEEVKDRDAASEGEKSCEIEVETAKNATRREKSNAERGGAVIERDQGECTEGPEDEGVGEAGERALADNLGLAENLPEEVPKALAKMSEMKTGVWFGAENALEDKVKSLPKTPYGYNSKREQEHLLVG